ncbi:MAG: YheV family putative metal-binding protein [Alteromonadaceae bacterium]|nr:YheV family putative metal-binding protein [Alteromonadaceae bacterium]
MKNVIKKRFISGAICPQCKAMDTMALTKENNVETVTCVACGEKMVQPEVHVEKKTRAKEQIIGVFTPE